MFKVLFRSKKYREHGPRPTLPPTYLYCLVWYSNQCTNKRYSKERESVCLWSNFLWHSSSSRKASSNSYFCFKPRTSNVNTMVYKHLLHRRCTFSPRRTTWVRWLVGPFTQHMNFLTKKNHLGPMISGAFHTTPEISHQELLGSDG